MVAIASRARALSTLAAAGATLVTALALTPAEQGAPRPSCPVREHADDGMRLEARWTSRPEAGEHVVVEIAAPGDGLPARPPLSVVIAIDHSRSMTGEPLAHAKAAAARLVSQLDAGDAFSVVAYSDGHTTVVPMLRATAVHKELALRAIAELAVDNGTCISCGLELAGAWLGRTPVEAGVRRVVLISDGYANLGLRDRDELVQLAADTAARGASITTVGVGLDFDEQTMMRIAEVGRGNYYYVADTGRLDAAFDREVAALAEVIATNVQLTVQVPPGVRIEEVVGYATVIQPPRPGSAAPISAGDSVSIPLADWEAGEQRTVVMRVSGRPAPCSVIARLGWRSALGGSGRGALAVARIAAPDAPDASGAIERALAGAALERAAELHARRGPAAARRDLEDHAAALDRTPARDLAPAARETIRARLGEAAAAFGAAAGGGDGARALKRARELARDLTR